MATTLLISESQNTAEFHHNGVGPISIDLNKPSHAQDLFGTKDDLFFVIDKRVLFPQFESVELNVWQEKGVYGAMVHCYLDDIETIHDVAFTEREFYADITLAD